MNPWLYRQSYRWIRVSLSWCRLGEASSIASGSPGRRPLTRPEVHAQAFGIPCRSSSRTPITAASITFVWLRSSAFELCRSDLVALERVEKVLTNKETALVSWIRGWLTILYQVTLHTGPGQLGVWPIVAVGVDGTYWKGGGAPDHSGFAVMTSIARMCRITVTVSC